MLKGIPSIIPPELLKILMEMGHGDELVIADGNYPKNAHPQNVVRCDGHGVPEILDAVLSLMPLDSYVENPCFLMAVAKGDDYKPEVWDVYREIGKKYEAEGLREISLERFEFYQRSRKAWALVTSSESALYANIIIKKGVIK